MNWIINTTIMLNVETLSQFGFNNGDKIAVLYSKIDNCFYITKTNIGDNKLYLYNDTAGGISLRTRNKFLADKLGSVPTKRIYFDIFQDEYDKQHNSIKCIIKKDE